MARMGETEKGVGGAFADWLSYHPVSLGDIIELAIKAAFTEWLNKHSDELLEKLAERGK